MDKKTKAVVIGLLLALFIELPIWFYLLHWAISQLHPDRLIWFLFYIYVPVCIVTTILSKVITNWDKE
jgi:hypothetical protein